MNNKEQSGSASTVLQNPNIQVALKFLRDNGTLVALVILALFFTFADEAFFTPRNLTNLARQTTIVGIIAVGMTMVILINGIDLSVGSIVGLAAITVTLLMQAGVNMWLAVALTILISGVLVGLWNGFWVAHYNIPPFIITLGMMTIARGLALTLSKGGSVPVTNPSFAKIGGDFIPAGISGIIIVAALALFLFALYRDIQQKKKYGVRIRKQEIISSTVVAFIGLALCFYVFTAYRGIPYPVAIFVVIAFIGLFDLQNTIFGRRLYAMGGN
jgi:D-xylose transport system permease protein